MLYTIAYLFVAVVARLFFRIRIIGRENIPREGGVIVAANHSSYLDIPLLGYSIGRRADYMGKKELFNIPILSTIFRRLGGFPVDRNRFDRTALREAIRRLESGRVLVIYPEGRRSMDGKLQPGKPGIGIIVKMSGKKVVPAAIQGTEKAMPPGKWMIRPAQVTIRFGRPLDFGDLVKRGNEKEGIEEITRIIMKNIGGLLERGRGFEGSMGRVE